MSKSSISTVWCEESYLASHIYLGNILGALAFGSLDTLAEFEAYRIYVYSALLGTDRERTPALSEEACRWNRVRPSAVDLLKPLIQPDVNSTIGRILFRMRSQLVSQSFHLLRYVQTIPPDLWIILDFATHRTL